MIRQQFLSNLLDKSSNKHFQLHFSHYSTYQMLDYFRRNEEVDASLQDEYKTKSSSSADISVKAEQYQPNPQTQQSSHRAQSHFSNNQVSSSTNDRRVTFNDVCGYCRRPNHSSSECRKRLNDEGNAGMLVPASQALNLRNHRFNYQ